MNPLALNNRTLANLPDTVSLPKFDRSKLTTGIVHLSVGNFCRSHLALYTQDLMSETSVSDLGIYGFNIRKNSNNPNLEQNLNSQDGLYTILEKDNQQVKATVCGSISSLRSIENGSEELLNFLSNPHVKVLSMTITEGGYSRANQMLNSSVIARDLNNPTSPESVPGIIVEALNRRFNRGLKPFVVLSCDNLIGNGNVTREMVLAFAEMRDAELARRIGSEVCFPNSMVDRITPVTTAEDIAICKSKFGILDLAPVPCEPFKQWVIEDNGKDLLPKWDLAGAQFVQNVHPYEEIKLRLLNAGHSAIGCGGFLAKYEYIHEIVADPIFSGYLSSLLSDEIAPNLKSAPGMPIPQYIASVLQRFSNENIGDTALRICENSSSKFPTYVFPSVSAALERESEISGLALSVANWLRFLTGFNEQHETFQICDPLASELQPLALQAYQTKNANCILKHGAVFGDLSESERFSNEVQKAYERVISAGVLETLKSYK